MIIKSKYIVTQINIFGTTDLAVLQLYHSLRMDSRTTQQAVQHVILCSCSLLAATSQFSAFEILFIYLTDCVFTLNDNFFVCIECTLMLMVLYKCN